LTVSHLAQEPSSPSATSPDGWVGCYDIRTYRHEDASACQRLYRDGLLGGQIADNDTGLDIDDISTAYLAAAASHFWVATVTRAGSERTGLDCGTVVGMIGVQHHDEHVGEIRRLRVDSDHRRRRIGSRLLETAIRFCRDTGCLKVTLDTYIERDAAVGLFERHQFRHGRTRSIQGKDMLYFYLDLYTQDAKRA
jgi:ribosomal protein S18 acetylase RimI-like enzyme